MPVGKPKNGYEKRISKYFEMIMLLSTTNYHVAIANNIKLGRYIAFSFLLHIVLFEYTTGLLIILTPSTVGFSIFLESLIYLHSNIIKIADYL